MRSSFKRTAAQRLVNFATFCAVISLGAVLSKYHLVFDLISHFRVQYIVLLIPAFIVAMSVRKTNSIMIMSLALAVHGYAVTMSVLPVSADVIDKDDFVELKVLNSNLLLVNSEYEAQLAFINKIDPDIVTFEEYTHDWHNVLTTQLTEYPHRATSPTHGAFGIAMYSKFPIASGGIDVFSDRTPLVVDATINLGDKLVRVIAAHPPPPVSIEMYDIRNELMRLIGQKTEDHNHAVVVMGDFNATPWTTHFTNMTSVGKLRDARAGHGLHPTWPTNMFPLQIPIDHILISPQIGAVHFAAEHVIGSDHRSIWGVLRVY